MSDTLIVTSPGIARTDVAITREEHRIARTGATLLARVSHGTVAVGDANTMAELERRGFEVTRYQDTDKLRIAGTEIDVADPLAGVAKNEQVLKADMDRWPLHVVQLVGPPFPEWIERIERLGAQRIARADRYGLYIYADAAVLKAIAELPFVAMVSPLQPAWKLDSRLRELEKDRIEQLSITVFPPDEANEVARYAGARGGKVVRVEESAPGRRDASARVVVEIAVAEALGFARLPNVRSVALLPRPRIQGERSTQILAENLDNVAAPDTGPVTGYGAFLADIDADGTGVTVAIVDSGIDVGANNNNTGHVDLRGRQTAYIDYNNVPTDQNGHGTHVAGIAVGNATTGLTEGNPPDDFLWGQGTAPGANYLGQSVADPADPAGPGLLVPSMATLTTDAATNGATVQNNSWSGDGSPNSYTQLEEDMDAGVRDADDSTNAFDPLTVVFAASNDGGLASTIGDPSAAKNVITVGNGLNRRPNVNIPSDDIRGLRGSSARGPASGNRIKPDVVATGTDVSSARSSACNRAAIQNTNNLHLNMSGTSQAAPHVTGACVVLTEWWRDRTGGHTPGPAMLKALLINGAEDMVGGPNWRAIRLNRIQQNPDRYRSAPLNFVPDMVADAGSFYTQVNNLNALGFLDWFFDPITSRVTIQANFNGSPLSVRLDFRDGMIANLPNNDQGWGRVSLGNIVYQTPDSDRGPRLFIDQRHAFDGANQSHSWRVRPVDANQPMRVTLVYTDAPGSSGDATPLVNNLNLEVANNTTTWRGNPANFNNGFTTAGGVGDTSNNVECVYLSAPAGVYEVTVRGATVTEDAREPGSGNPWQDYALVLENAEFAAANPVSICLALDRSNSMNIFGYVGVTRTSSKAFVDLMEADDLVGVVSFGDDGQHEYSDKNEVVLITGTDIQEDAKAAINNIQFSGCTYMGDGLTKAEQQLSNAPGKRAIVLMSDGKDNKGCDENNPNRPWAVDVAASLPASIDVYTCAMGPLSDQQKLEDIALNSGGLYYYMPTIDDLYEIYNYIRGNVTGDGVIVNATATASSSSVSAWVDCGAERAVLACNWHTETMHWVPGKPEASNQISVALRTPGGKKVPAGASWINRRVGDGYVIFTIDDPRPGRWQVVVETAGEQHVSYTVGGWVRSDLKLLSQIQPSFGGAPVYTGVLGLAVPARRNLKAHYRASLLGPTASLDHLMKSKEYREVFDRIKPNPALIKEGYSEGHARVVELERQMWASGKPSIFQYKTQQIRPVQRTTPRFDYGFKPVVESVGRMKQRTWAPTLEPALSKGDALFTHDLKLPTPIPGSYTLHISASGVDLDTGCRFQRFASQSFTVRPG